jgi:saccharopine dehydrogenase-like NADP-dependent oxidoreductase
MAAIQIAGAGGIGKAAAQIIITMLPPDTQVIVGDRSRKALDSLLDFVSHHDRVTVYEMDFGSEETGEMFDRSDVVLDCLPGSLAPKVARLCLDHKAHYANLTEYVAETEEIEEVAADAETGFILQTGLAPGYINVLAHKLFKDFCSKYNVDRADSISMKVGALTRNAVAPHFYGFTWSPIGVATEYVKDAIVLKDHEVQNIQALSRIESVLIDGEWYEDNYTSGGAADLPTALKDKVRNLDYRTLRYPGHYSWVKSIMDQAPSLEERIPYLEKTMLEQIPSFEEDVVIVYAQVTGKDDHGVLRSLDKSLKIFPTLFGDRVLTAIQATTAGPLIQSANMLLSGQYKGVVLQSQIDPYAFLEGAVVKKVYG